VSFAYIWCSFIIFHCKSTGIVVTNDGNAILRELDLAHPAAKVFAVSFVWIHWYCFVIIHYTHCTPNL